MSDFCSKSNNLLVFKSNIHAQLYSARHKAKEKVDKVAFRLAAELGVTQSSTYFEDCFPVISLGRVGGRRRLGRQYKCPLSQASTLGLLAPAGKLTGKTPLKPFWLLL